MKAAKNRTRNPHPRKILRAIIRWPRGLQNDSVIYRLGENDAENETIRKAVEEALAPGKRHSRTTS